MAGLCKIPRWVLIASWWLFLLMTWLLSSVWADFQKNWPGCAADLDCPFWVECPAPIQLLLQHPQILNGFSWSWVALSQSSGRSFPRNWSIFFDLWFFQCFSFNLLLHLNRTWTMHAEFPCFLFPFLQLPLKETWGPCICFLSKCELKF